MIKKIIFLSLTIIFTIALPGCSDNENNNESYNESNIESGSLQYEHLIGTYGSDIGETIISKMHIDSDGKIYVLYSEDMGDKYVYNVTEQKKSSKNIDDIEKADDTVLDEKLVEVSLRGTFITITDENTKTLLNKIPTNLNEDSVPMDVYFTLTSSISVDVYDDYIYMLNENGIFKAKYNDREFTQIINSEDTNYINVDDFRESLDYIYADSDYISYDLFVVSESKFYVAVRISDYMGYGYIIYYTEYGL